MGIAIGEYSVLVVDEDPSVLAMATAILEPVGFRLLRARSAAEAIEICGRDYVTIHAAVIDVVLPGGSGPELAMTLRGKRPGLPILYMSAFDDRGVIRIGLARQSGNANLPLADAILSAIVRAHN